MAIKEAPHDQGLGNKILMSSERWIDTLINLVGTIPWCAELIPTLWCTPLQHLCTKTTCCMKRAITRTYIVKIYSSKLVHYKQEGKPPIIIVVVCNVICETEWINTNSYCTTHVRMYMRYTLSLNACICV